jgi:Ca2+-binding RTX toxin-like protein
MERLEDRTMMSASATVVDRVLTIQGTDYSDHITISTFNVQVNRVTLREIQVTIKNPFSDGLQKTFFAASIDRIFARGMAGDDIIENATAKPSELFGDGGSDLVYGGSGADKLYAGSATNGVDSGTNYLYGNGGNDTLFGGKAVDKLYGGTGADYIYGGDGEDEP